VKKSFLVFFIFLDLAAMAGAVFVLYDVIAGKQRGVKSAPPKMGAMRVLTSTGPAAAVLPTAPASVPVTPATPYRNIGFTYKNTKAKLVLIRADFTGWKGVPMKRDDHGLWSYEAQLTPGEYAYCFTVDDKIIKDPAGKHTKRIAQTIVSAITVEKAPVTVSP
jgi:hypothetical protein